MPQRLNAALGFLETTMAVQRIQASLAALFSMVLNIWLSSLRCPASPDVDWSRFGFAATLQLAAVAIPIAAVRVYSDSKGQSRIYAAMVAAFLVIASVPMVRASVLLSDTVQNKFYPSKGYECPGVRW